ncbi:MAG: type II toxin-antitoxin system RelE/ParE family toxin [Candidatus Scalindua sp.]
MADYLIRPKATEDLENIWDYTFEAWGIEQADQYIKDLINACSTLAINSDMGLAREELHIGLHVHPSGKHLIFYLKIENGVDVVRILHERMDSSLHFALK